MEFLKNLFKVILLALVEGITEFLPVSSTGHLILVNDFIKLQPESFANSFNIIIQLGAILSVMVLYFPRLNPWAAGKQRKNLPPINPHWNTQTKFYVRIFKRADRPTLRLWANVLIGCIPGGIFGLLFHDVIKEKLMNSKTVVVTLLLYGILIIVMERWNKGRKKVRFQKAQDIPYSSAFLIGCFQCLAMVPGTSRSAATIIGAMLIGTSRLAAAEFSFFLAIPTMIGTTLLELIKEGASFSGQEWLLILIGFFLSFLVAGLVIRKFIGYIQHHDFEIFGWYRIVLAILLIIYMLITM